jgi:hypothetical protein
MRCRKCYVDKHNDQFYCNRRICIDCKKMLDSHRLRHPISRLKRMYATMKLSAKRRKIRRPTFSFNSFKKRAYNNWYQETYTARRDSLFDPFLVPSVDRIDNSRWYVFNNMQLMWRHDNRVKNNSDPDYNEKGEYAPDLPF